MSETIQKQLITYCPFCSGYGDSLEELESKWRLANCSFRIVGVIFTSMLFCRDCGENFTVEHTVAAKDEQVKDFIKAERVKFFGEGEPDKEVVSGGPHV